MKKLVCLMMAMVLVFSFASLTGAYEAYDNIIATSGEKGFSFDLNEVSTESIAYFTSSTTCDSLTMYTAAYKNKKLVAIGLTELEDITPGSFSVPTGIDWTNLDKDEVKIMVWNDNAHPYASYEYEVSEEEEPTGVRGVVVSTPLMEYVRNGYYPEMNKTVGIMTSDGEHIVFDCSEISDIENYYGKNVSVKTENNSVCEIAEVPGMNTVTTIVNNQLVEQGDRYFEDDGIIGYLENGAIRVTGIDLAYDVTTVVNYGSESWNVRTTADLVENFGYRNGKIEFISNDGDSNVDIISCTVYGEEAVVENVVAESGIISFECYIGWIEDYDAFEDRVYTKVVKDGEAASISDIQQGDTVSRVETDEDSVIIYHVSSEVVEGMVSSYDDKIVEIGGEEYRLSPHSSYGQTSDLAAIEGTFFINVCGEIAFDKPVRKEKYAVILAVARMSGINGGWEVQAAMEDGTVEVYPLNSRAYIEDETDRDENATAEALAQCMIEDGYECWKITADEIENSVYEVLIKNDTITKLVRLDGGYSTSGKCYDEKNMCYGAISFDEETVVVSVAAEGTEIVEADDVEIGKISDFLKDGEGENAEIISFDEDNNDISGLVIGFGLNSASSGEEGGDVVEPEPENTVVNAVILGVGVKPGLTGGWEAEVVLEDGTSGLYTLNRRAFIEGENDDNKSDESTAEILAEAMEWYGDYGRITVQNIADSVYKITLLNGEIKKLARLAPDVTASGKQYDAGSMTYGDIKFDDETVIASVEASAEVEIEDIIIGRVSDFFVDGGGESAEIFAFDDDGDGIADFAVGFGLGIEISRGADAVIVKSVRNVDVDGEMAVAITGLQAGADVEYTIYNEDGEYTTNPSELGVGDVILTTAADAEGFVKDVEMLYNFDSYESSELVAEDNMGSSKNEFYYAGMLDKERDITDSKFCLVGVNEDIIMRSSANYTLVDFSENIRRPEIKKAEKGISIFGSPAKYDSEVFVRYYDDEIKEVVVYRTFVD